ncbi:hypothetical protein ABZW11_30930 [Nonomuraea sp. NPDC004580]|uniref:hypothetical protein n=1 Tax=Nonomuraea sp. NPDC004580 TaxID=3154552 RepID=UPI0033A0C182
MARDRMRSETGLQSFQDHEQTSDQRPGLHHDLVGSTPGNLVIATDAGADICGTAETYQRRPPVEVAGSVLVMVFPGHGDHVLVRKGRRWR